MHRPIFNESRQQVTKSGVLSGAAKTCADFYKSLAENFQAYGEFAKAYMAGGISDVHDWGYRTRNSKNLASGLDGINLMLEFLFGECEAVRDKKGFLYPAFLSTPREHRECGSSGYKSYAGPNGEYDDMPVPLANQMLRLEPAERIFTVDEIRRARELLGEPTIDARGFVTGVTVKRDSYHFLRPEEVPAVKAREAQIGSALDLVAANVLETHTAAVNKFMSTLRRYLTDAGEGECRISTPCLIEGAPDIRHAETGEPFGLYGIATDAKAVAFGLGYRDRILTPQEIAIARRSVTQGLNPHVPVGIQTGELSRDLAAKRRTEEQRIMVYTNAFFGYDFPTGMSLEPLESNGLTARGPLIIDPRTGEPWQETMDASVKASDVPFARPGDWFFKG